MPLTTEGEVFRELLTDLQAILLAGTPSLNADRVYIRAVPGFDTDVKPPHVQLVPGGATSIDEDTGVVTQSFQTVVFNRLTLGEPGIDTGRVSDSTYGLLNLRNVIRGDGGTATPGIGNTPSGLINLIVNNGTADITLFGIKLTGWSVPQTNPADPYWVMATDSWRFTWEIF